MRQLLNVFGAILSTISLITLLLSENVRHVQTCATTSTPKTAINIAAPASSKTSSGVSSSSSSNNPSGRSDTIATTQKPKSCGYNQYTSSNVTPGISGRVLGGYNASPYEYPWMVYLDIYNRNTGERKTCGGSVISSSWILTSAQCCSKATFAQDINGRLGGNDLTGSMTSITLSQMIVHPSYNTETMYNYDFCLLQISVSLTFGDGKIQPICLPDSCDQTCQTGEVATITGWGVTSSGGSTSSSLRKAEVPVVSSTSCAQTYGTSIVSSTMICAGYLGEGGVDTCTGDGGGPLQCRKNGYYTVDGVSSFGRGCGLAGYPGVYSRVCTVKYWIDTYINSGTTPTTSTTTTSSTTTTRTITNRDSVTGTTTKTNQAQSTCGQGTFNGTNYTPTAQPGEFPWHVYLVIYVRLRQSYQSCGGVYVKNSWILTPAHCCQQVYQTSDITAYFQGDSISTSFIFSVPVTNMAIHSQFNSASGANDFCLLKVNVPTAWQTYWNIVPICLPDSCDSSVTCQSGDVAVVVSWNSAQTGSNPSAILLKSYLPIYSNTYCQSGFGSLISDANMCTATSSSICATLDESRMLVCKKRGFYTVDGVSIIGNCATTNSPLIFSQVCQVRTWLNQVTLA